jgi:hypothetical protein
MAEHGVSRPLRAGTRELEVDPSPAPEAGVSFTPAKVAGRSAEYAVARTALDPEARHAALNLNASSDLFAGSAGTVNDTIDVLRDMAEEVAAQDMSGVSRILMSQAVSMDALFTQLARRAHANLGQYPEAAERYLRLGLKAQAQSRTTLETLAKLHQPREQTVRHIHVGPDGQAVFIENLHGGLGNVRSTEQAHAQSASGSPLLSHDTGGKGVPLSGGQGEAPVSHARRRSRQRGPGRE